MKYILILVYISFSFQAFSQSKEMAINKAKEAIKLMDTGEIDRSIEILEECKKLDPDEFSYMYEIAYAYTLKKDYKQAVEILEKTKKYRNINSQVYQLSGNCYNNLGDPDKAINEYEEGLKKFPKAANLNLEKGDIFFLKGKYHEALLNYQQGVENDPMYASNYFRLSLILLNSRDKLSGLIYGEIFMNLERNTDRTLEISKLLFETYKNSITFKGDSTKVDFCNAVIVDGSKTSVDNIKLPFCFVFEKNLFLSIQDQKEINLKSLSNIRIKFIENYFKKDYIQYPNVLFEFHKALSDKGLLESYNYYIFQMGNLDEFNRWGINNEREFERFVDWYTNPKNYLKIDDNNKFIAEY